MKTIPLIFLPALQTWTLLLCGLTEAHAATLAAHPSPGDVFREYSWKTEKFHVLGLDEKPFDLPSNIDLKDARRAEIAVEIANQHMGFEGMAERSGVPSAEPATTLGAGGDALPRLRVSDNHRFLITEKNQPFFWLGDTAWELFHRLNREEADRYLSDRAKKGFTIIQAVALAELDGLKAPSRAGFVPLINGDPARPEVRPGPANDYWDFVDEVVALAEERGLYVALLPTWGKYVTSHPFNGSVDGIFNVSNALAYGQFIGARYQDRRNLIWILGGDKAPSTPEALAIWRAMAKGIAIGVAGREDYSAVLMTYHTSGPGHVSDYLHDEPWLDFTSAQSSHGNLVESWRFIEKYWNRQPVKPVVDLESSYPDAYIPAAWLPAHLRTGHLSTGPGNDDHARRAAYWAVFAGAFGHTYGHNSIWQMYAPPRQPILEAKRTWQEAMDAPSATQMVYLRGLIESRPFLTQVPDPSLLADAPTDPLEHLAALRGDGYALIYTPTGKPFRVRLDKLSGKLVKAWWFDPRAGRTTAAGQFAREGEREFDPPGEPGVGHDWVLALDDPGRGLGPPRVAFESYDWQGFGGFDTYKWRGFLLANNRWGGSNERMWFTEKVQGPMRLLHVLPALSVLAFTAPAAEPIPLHQAKQMSDAAPSKARVSPRKPRRVLIWNTPPHLMEKDPHKGYCIPYGSSALEAIGKKAGAYEPVVTDDLAVYLPENIRRFDAIVMNNSSGPWITPTDADLAKDAFQKHGVDKATVEQALRKSLLDFIRNGGGLVSLHFAIAANAHWPEFKELLGGTFTGHPWNEEIGVTVEEPDHPLAAAFGGKDFRLADEIYEYGPPYDRSKLRVLLSLDPARSNMGVKWITRKDNDFALAWVKSFGQGRVFNTSFGHRTELFWDPRVLAFYLDAIQFATGDLEAPTAPRTDRPVRPVAGTDPVPAWPGSNPGSAQVWISNSSGGVNNRVLSAAWSFSERGLQGGFLRDQQTGRSLTLTGEVFQVVLKDGTRYPASELRSVGTPTIVELKPQPAASRLAERMPGRKIEVRLTAADGRLGVTWRALALDDAHYLRQEIEVTALKQDLGLREVVWFQQPVPDESTAGTVDGSPVIAGPFFLGCEDPMALNQAASRGDEVICRLPREATLRHGETLTSSFVLGVAPAGQMRRAFLDYLERERAHPYRPYLHYNSWYDTAWDPFALNETNCLEAIRLCGDRFIDPHGVIVDGMVFDDGWDDPKTLWQFHRGFPNGFTPLAELCRQYHTRLGVWLSPFGGYGEPKDQRLRFGREQGFETNATGFSLAGPKYYAAFKQSCVNMIRRFGVNHFKFDGIATGMYASGGAEYVRDTEAMRRLMLELRQEDPNLYINLTTGSWPSPFWLRYADSVWRQGGDMGHAGKGAKQQQWLTYRDQETYRNIVRKGPLYPLNSLMTQGVAYSRQGMAGDPTFNSAGFQDDVHAFFGSGTGLQELYIQPGKLTANDWAVLAEAAKWSRANADVLVDTHWIGGDPGKLEVYGYASWSARKGIVMLRNPDDQPQEFALDVGAAFELPAGAATRFKLRSPWTEDAAKPVLDAKSGTPLRLELKPFEIVVLDAVPSS